MSPILGYARVSTDDQDLAGQKRRLEAAGAFRVFEDVISGKTFDRPGLSALLDYLRPGDTLAVVRLDRLGRSLRELLNVVETLKQHSVALRSLEEQLLDTIPPRKLLIIFYLERGAVDGRGSAYERRWRARRVMRRVPSGMIPRRVTHWRASRGHCGSRSARYAVSSELDFIHLWYEVLSINALGSNAVPGFLNVGCNTRHSKNVSC